VQYSRKHKTIRFVWGVEKGNCEQRAERRVRELREEASCFEYESALVWLATPANRLPAYGSGDGTAGCGVDDAAHVDLATSRGLWAEGDASSFGESNGIRGGRRGEVDLAVDGDAGVAVNHEIGNGTTRGRNCDCGLDGSAAIRVQGALNVASDRNRSAGGAGNCVGDWEVTVFSCCGRSAGRRLIGMKVAHDGRKTRVAIFFRNGVGRDALGESLIQSQRDLLSYGLSLGLGQVVAAGVSTSGGQDEQRGDNHESAEGRTILYRYEDLHTKHGNLLRKGNFLRDFEDGIIVRHRVIGLRIFQAANCDSLRSVTGIARTRYPMVADTLRNKLLSEAFTSCNPARGWVI
jgi:hypothetical protein